MRPDRALASIFDHQQRIAELLRQADAVMMLAPPELRDRAERLRWQLLRALRAYQLFKHVEVFDPLIRTATSSRAGLASAMKERCIGMANAYQEHVREWSLCRTEDDWHRYRSRSRAMIALLKSHLLREARDATTLLSGIKRTRCP